MSFVVKLKRFGKYLKRIGIEIDWYDPSIALDVKLFGGGGPKADQDVIQSQLSASVPGRNKLNRADPARYIASLKSYDDSEELQRTLMLSNVDLKLLRFLDFLETGGQLTNGTELSFSRFFSASKRNRLVEEEPITPLVSNGMLERRMQGRVVPTKHDRSKAEVIYHASVAPQEKLNEFFNRDRTIRSPADAQSLRDFILDLASKNSRALKATASPNLVPD